MGAEQPSPDVPSVLTAAERAEIEARYEGTPPQAIRRALRHGGGILADRAEARAQSRLFDALARAAVGTGAEQRRADLTRGTAGAATAEVPAGDSAQGLAAADAVAHDLLQHRKAGLLWRRLARADDTDPAG
jgi:hypothetical protein